MKRHLRGFAKACLAAGLVLACAQAQAADAGKGFPAKPITLLVGFAAGGSVDNAARLIAQTLGAAGWNVVVQNRTGASGLIAMRELARSAPDGYTLMMGSVSNLAMVPAAMKNPQIDPVRDLAPVVQIGSAPLVLIVPPDSPIHSVKDLIKQAKGSADGLNYASGGIATPPHLAGALFASMAGVSVNHIPYRGEAPAIVDLIGKQVPVMFANITAAMPQVQGKTLRAVAVTSKERVPVAPSIPTMSESGLPGFEVQNWYGIMAPAATPGDVVARIHDEVTKVLRQPDLKKQFSDQGFTIENMSSADFGKHIQSEFDKWAKVTKAVGVTLD